MLLFTLYTASAEPLFEKQDANQVLPETTLNRRNKRKTRKNRKKRRRAQKQSMHGINIGIGSLGGVLGYSYAPNHKIAFSAQYAYLPAPAQEYEINAKNYTDTTLLSTFSIKGHLHPVPKLKWFHLSAGVAYSMSTINLDLAEGTYQIGDATDITAEASSTVDFSDIQPYLGLGAGYTNKKGWGFFLDLGVNMQGEPVVENNIITDATDAELSDENIQQETNAIFDHYNAYQFFPVIQLGASYMF